MSTILQKKQSGKQQKEVNEIWDSITSWEYEILHNVREKYHILQVI